MDLEIIREYCLSLPGASEKVQWGDNLLFNVGGKIFLLYNMGLVSVNRLSIKCTPEKFQELIEDENIIPAPYYARNNWVCIQDGCRMKLNELKELIHDSYELVCSKLPVKIRKELVKDSKE